MIEIKGRNQLKISVTDVLIDMDKTIACSKERAPTKNVDTGLINQLAELIIEEKKVSEQEALARIYKAGDPAVTCIFSFLPALGILPESYWDKVRQYYSKYVEVCPDAALLIRSLPGKGIRLYLASTNSRMASLAKLSVANLATIEGSAYFAGFFGGDAFGEPQGKFSPNFFPGIIKKAGLDPEKTLMIGDDPKTDLIPALAAGIKQVVIVKRDQKEPVIKKDDHGIYVNSLERVLDMLE